MEKPEKETTTVYIEKNLLEWVRNHNYKLSRLVEEKIKEMKKKEEIIEEKLACLNL